MLIFDIFRQSWHKYAVMILDGWLPRKPLRNIMEVMIVRVIICVITQLRFRLLLDKLMQPISISGHYFLATSRP
jgi:hypothetical protein